MTAEKIEKKSSAEKISAFTSKYKFLLLIIAGAIIVALVIFGITVNILSNRLEKNIEQAELFQERYVDWAFNTDDLTDEELAEIGDVLESEITKFIDKVGSGYPQLRSLYVKASLEYKIENYSEAAESFSSLAEAYPKSHLAAPALMNAGVCYEEIDNLDKAIEQYTKVAENYIDRSPEVPHALFSIGRLYEKQNNNTEAINIYRELSEKYSSSEWAKLAVSRIITLE